MAQETTTVQQRPFLKWAGCKYSSLKHIRPLLQGATRLIEPFAGSGVVFLNTEFQDYRLAETNRDLVQLFNLVKTEGPSFIEYCRRFFVPKHNAAEYYYDFRDEFNRCKNRKRRAGLFLYLNRHGYNGLCRYNSSGQFNVPFGTYKNIYFPSRELLAFHQKAQRAEFIHADFRQSFANAQPGDIIYCDPPYAPIEQQSNFTRYSKLDFTLADQIELAKLANETAKRGIPVIISNHDTHFTREQYQGSKISSFLVARRISRRSQDRQPTPELLALFD